MSPSEYRKIILEKLPQESVLADHDDTGHFYKVPALAKRFPSVTGKLQILKDQSLINYKMNRALDHVFEHWKEFSESTVMEFLDQARNASGLILEDAGDIGTLIHACRERYFSDWIASGVRPADVLEYLPKEEEDIRAVSGLRALEKFCDEWGYIPIATELLVYSEEFALGGTLDDIGLVFTEKFLPSPHCSHDACLRDFKWRYQVCLACGKKWNYVFCLMDIKTSNQFKDHYFFQVAMYYDMFRTLTGLRPRRQFIVKLSKEDGTYKIEELRQIGKLVHYAHNMLKTDEGVEFVKKIRKDNQKLILEF